MIVVTFQNAVLEADLSKYLELFSPFDNPNGCKATGTFFVSHQYTDYFSVQTLASQRHEIGINSITSGNGTEYWKNASEELWKDELQGQMEILQLLANVNKTRLLGERAPYLQMGGDNQMRAVQKSKLLYDASRPTRNGSTSPNLLWPYTYDYISTQDCAIPPCPSKSFPGIWQIPLLDFKDKNGFYWPTLDGCNVSSVADVFILFHTKFVDHYLSNRAPLVLTLSSAWINSPFKRLGTAVFLDYVLGLKDVFLVPAKSVIDWIRAPTPVSKLDSFKPWQCKDAPPPVCNQTDAKLCRYDEHRRITNGTAKYQTRACVKECPKCYPWLDDTHGVKC